MNPNVWTNIYLIGLDVAAIVGGFLVIRWSLRKLRDYLRGGRF